MKFFGAGVTIGAVLFAQLSLVCAKHGHSHLNALERRHRHHSRDGTELKERQQQELESRAEGVEKRGGQCQFPTDAGLVAVTPDSSNAGWAMSPDQPCEPGNYCPYACPSGQMMAQWDPSATSYSYPKSQVGLCVLSTYPAKLTAARMVVFTATPMAVYLSRFLINLTVWTAPETLELTTRPAILSHFVKPFYQETRPC